MAGQSIAEIKKEYDLIKSMGVMEYKEQIAAIDKFALTHMADERAGVVKIVDSAIMFKNTVKAELGRINSMMRYERKHAGVYHHICGVDEVGRGPLAGPIVAAAVILPPEMIIPYLNDSKLVTEKRREELYDIIMENAVAVGIGIKSEKFIDEKGIQAADTGAMREAVEKLKVPADMILVDAFQIPDVIVKQEPIIKGDTLSVSIAAASIIAKVTRDRMMVELAEKYPGYDFEKNKGYGSPKHLSALKTVGPCEIHRRSFIKNYV